MKTKISLILALCAFQSSLSFGQTSAVPGTISYQGKVFKPDGTLVGGLGAPVNRTVIFRIWNDSSNTAAANLLYSESQTVTISDGEFSVLVGNGIATTTQTFGYSETAKHSSASPAVNLADVFNGSSRYLSVTVASGASITTSDAEISPRQQIVSSAFAYRSKFAENLGTSTSGTSLTVVDAGNVGIGSTTPGVKLQVEGGIKAAGGSPVFAGGLNNNFGYGFGPAGDSDGGMFSPSDGVITWWTNNVERMRLDAAGNLGIGTNNPGFPLNFADTLGDKISLYRNSGNSNGFGIQPGLMQIHTDVSTADIGFGYGSSAAFTETMRITGTGLVNLTNNLNFSNPPNGTNRGIFGTSGVSDWWNIYGLAAADNSGSLIIETGDDSNEPIIFKQTGNERMRVAANGSIGIGTATPSERLTVGGNISAFGDSVNLSLVGSGASANKKMELGIANLAAGFSTSSVAGDAVIRASSRLLLQTGAGNAAITIDSSNNVGINTTSPGAKLDVSGALLVSGNASVSHSQGLNFEWNRSATGESWILNQKGSGTGGIVFGEVSTVNAITETMRIAGNGNVSIGIGNFNVRSGNVTIGAETEKASLTVNNSRGSTSLGNYDYLTLDRNLGDGPPGPFAYSIYASGKIAASQLDVFSDKRIKHVQGHSDSTRDLSTLLGIEVTDYTFIDTVAEGVGKQKKVIAQQVEKIFPQAVSQHTDVVPDIFRKATIKDGWVMLATDLKKGERVRLIGAKEAKIVEVLEVRDDAFRTAENSSSEEVFVYGREVKDFRTVDYTAIGMLNVSATQELNRKIESLKDENAALKNQLEQLASAGRDQDAKLIAIEKRLNGSGDDALQPISLQTKVGQK